MAKKEAAKKEATKTTPASKATKPTPAPKAAKTAPAPKKAKPAPKSAKTTAAPKAPQQGDSVTISGGKLAGQMGTIASIKGESQDQGHHFSMWPR